MNTDIFLIFGYIGSANACIMMVPQIILTIKKKTMEDISISYISLNLLTQCLFLPYSIHFRLYPLLTVNCILGSCDLFIIGYYLYLKMNPKTTVLEEVFLDTSNV